MLLARNIILLKIRSTKKVMTIKNGNFKKQSYCPMALRAIETVATESPSPKTWVPQQVGCLEGKYSTYGDVIITNSNHVTKEYLHSSVVLLD